MTIVSDSKMKLMIGSSEQVPSYVTFPYHYPHTPFLGLRFCALHLDKTYCVENRVYLRPDFSLKFAFRSLS